MISLEDIRVELSATSGNCPHKDCLYCRRRAVLFAALDVAEGVCARKNTKLARAKFRRALFAGDTHVTIGEGSR